MEIEQTGLCPKPHHIPNPPVQEQQVNPRSRKREKVEKSIQEICEIVDLDDADGNDYGFFFTPISEKGATKRTAISVEQYSEERDFNLAVIASLTKPKKLENLIDLSQENQEYCYFDDYDIKVLNFKPGFTTFKRGNNRFADSVTENGQSSKSKSNPEFVCEICVETKTGAESFSIKGCTHSYCTDCMAKYVGSKLQENITYIPCPVSGCSGSLEPEFCRSILPQEVFDRWGNALCEAVIIGSQKFYCPYKDCSVMLIDDGGETVKEAECPNCWRMFCAQCKVPWHSGIECEEFQKLHKNEREREDILLMKMAENNHWRRCPNCRIYVERTHGCRYMKCRCGAAFCYTCGTAKIGVSTHYCSYCKG